MKQRLLFTLVAGMMVLAANAQNTPQIIKNVELQNADFSQSEPVKTIIYTYDYNMPDDGAGVDGTSLFGMQPVEGWTASHPSDNIKVMYTSNDTPREDGANAKAAGVFAYTTGQEDYTAGLGGEYLAPFDSDSPDRTGDNVLGIVAVWGSDIKYTQDVTLPAGDYMLIVKVYNGAGTGNMTKNNMGFVAADKSYLSSNVSYSAGSWTNDTIFFQLKEETTGKVQLGFAFGGGSGSAPHIFIDAVELSQIDPSYLIQVEIDKAKEELLAAIEEGQLYDVDTAPAEAVYNNPNATLEEVLAATEAQKERNQGSLTDLSEYFIQNPKFSEGEAVVGGICTYDYDCEKNGIATTNYSMLDVPGWTQMKTDNGAAAGVFALGSNAFLGGKDFVPPTVLSDGVTTEANLLGVVTCWSMAAQYKQDVTLPKGQYTITMSYFNTGGASAVAKNLIGFVESNGTEHLGETKQFPVGSWKTDIVQFTLDKETTGYFSLGYQSTNTGSGNMPHLFVDGFSLIYVGTGINASLMGLTSQVNGGLELLTEPFNKDLKDQFRTVVQAGKALVDAKSEDTEANKAATAAIKNMLADVNASIKAYKDLEVFRAEELIPANNKFNAESYAELNVQLNNMLDEVSLALTQYNWTTEKINETIASLPTIIKEGVQKAWDSAIASGEKLATDLDITTLFNLNYTYSTTAVSGGDVPDKEWSYGDASNFKTQYGTAEVWNQSPFTVSRTLTGLPAGKYTITTKGFFRTAANDANYADYEEGNTPEASVFANFNKTGLTNVAMITKVFGEEDDKSGWAVVDAESNLYVPNSQKAGYDIFNNNEYTALVKKSVSCVVSGNGELKFGVTAEQMEANCWVLWYGFELAYNALEASDMTEALDAMREKANDILDNNENVKKVVKAVDDLNAAKNAHASADPNSIEALRAVMAQYEAAFAYAEKADSLFEIMNDTYETYSFMKDDVESDEASYTNLMDNVNNATGDKVANNETMQQYIDQMKSNWAYFVAYSVIATASADNPEDITAAIYNNSFSDPAIMKYQDDEQLAKANNANGWTIERKGGKDEGQNAGADNEEQRHVYEFWNAETFSISQQLTGLPAGYYTIEMQGFNRSTNTPKDFADSLAVDPAFAKNVYLFASNGIDERTTAIKTIFEREDKEGNLETDLVDGTDEIAVEYNDVDEFYVPGSQVAFNNYAEADLYWNTVSIKLEEGNVLTLGLRKTDGYISGNWVVFDNFKLYYLGNGDEPDAIGGVEVDVKKQQSIYNVAGQRVAKAVKGLYIVNGKKVMVK